MGTPRAGAIAAIVLLAACSQTIVSPESRSGAYIVLEIDRDRLRHQQLENVLDQMAAVLDSESVRYGDRAIHGDAAIIRLIDATDLPRASVALRTSTSDTVFTALPDGRIEARISENRLQTLAEQAARQTRLVLATRIEGLGVRASVEVLHSARVRIQASESAFPDAVREMLPQQGRFTFHLVQDSSPVVLASREAPPGTMIALPYFKDESAELVEQRAVFTGERLIRAQPATDDQTGEYVLFFQLDAEGTELFCRATREHTGQRFAVLFDGRVLVAPRIVEPICGGTGQISGSFTAESVNELALILQSGALPAPVRIVEEGVGAQSQ